MKKTAIATSISIGSNESFFGIGSIESKRRGERLVLLICSVLGHKELVYFCVSCLYELIINNKQKMKPSELPFTRLKKLKDKTNLSPVSDSPL